MVMPYFSFVLVSKLFSTIYLPVYRYLLHVVLYVQAETKLKCFLGKICSIQWHSVERQRLQRTDLSDEMFFLYVEVTHIVWYKEIISVVIMVEEYR